MPWKKTLMTCCFVVYYVTPYTSATDNQEIPLTRWTRRTEADTGYTIRLNKLPLVPLIKDFGNTPNGYTQFKAAEVVFMTDTYSDSSDYIPDSRREALADRNIFRIRI